MNYQFDHIIHYVASPEKTLETAKAFGLHAVEGGRHETRGTYNTLCYFDLSYIEWIGIFNQQLVDENHVPLSVISSIKESDYTEGIVRLALRTTQIEKDAQLFREKGLEVIGPIDAKRRRPDGELIYWKQLYINDPTIEVRLPFLIEWQEPDRERRDSLQSQSIIAEHKLGSLKLQEIRIPVSDLTCATQWGDILHLKQETEKNEVRLRLDGGDIVFHRSHKKEAEPYEVLLQGATVDTSTTIFGATYRGLQKNESRKRDEK